MTLETLDTRLFVFRFGTDDAGFARLDEARRTLTIGGRETELDFFPCKILGVLLRLHQQFIKPARLQSLVQPQPVEEKWIYRRIEELRKALKPSALDTLIETDRNRGYRFSGHVDQLAVVEGARFDALNLEAGDGVPGRPEWRLRERLARSLGSEVWRAAPQGDATASNRVFKFAISEEGLFSLRNELLVASVLEDKLGPRPDIVAIVDWNLEADPYFVASEYAGESLQKLSEDDRAFGSLGLEHRIDVFLQVARAVAAAHGVGVMHMDLKPSNVLVTRHDDGSWQARVSDFGSGALLDRREVAEYSVEQYGLTVTQVIERGSDSGTMLYMSPERLFGEEAVVPALCDVFSLGMLLLHMVTGDFNRTLASGWDRGLSDRHLVDAIKAATDFESGERLDSVSRLVAEVEGLPDKRAGDVAERERQAREGELLAQAALEREKRQRLEARTPWIVATVAVLVIGVASLGFASERLSASRAEAVAAASRAEAVTRFLGDDVLGLADPYAAASTTPVMLEALKRAASRTDATLAGQTRTRATIHMTLARLFHKYGDFPAAEQEADKAINLMASLDGADAPSTLQARYEAVLPLEHEAKFKDAQAALARIDQDVAKAGVADSRTRFVGDAVRGDLLTSAYEPEKAIPHLQKALAELATVSTSNDEVISLVDGTRRNLISSLVGTGRYPEAVVQGRELLASLERRPAIGDLSIALAKGALGEALMFDGKYDEARTLVDWAAATISTRLGPSHAYAVMTGTTRCDIRVRQKETRDAIDCLESFSQTLLAAQPPKPAWLRWVPMANLGVFEAQSGQYPEAARNLDRASPGLEEAHAPDSELQYVRFWLAACRWKAGEPDAALALLDKLDAEQLGAVDPDTPWVQEVALLKGLALVSKHRIETARPVLSAAIAQLTGPKAEAAQPFLKEAQLALGKTP